MITIKRFGNVEIEGDEYLPEGVKIVASGSVQFTEGVLMSSSDVTFFAPIKEGEKE